MILNLVILVNLSQTLKADIPIRNIITNIERREYSDD